MRIVDKESANSYWSKRTAHNLSRKGKKYNPNKIQYKEVLGWHYISVPPQLDLYNEESRDATLDFIESIRQHSLSHKVMLDCSTAKSFSAAATLLLYSTIDRLKSNDAHRLVRFKGQKGDVKLIIEKTGLKSLTLQQDCTITDCKVDILPIVKGTARGEEFEQVIDYVQHQIYKNNMSPEQENVWGAAVGETVSNVKLHAYEDADEKPWWIICSVIGDDLYLAICDQGVGIPNTIKKQGWINSLVQNSPALVRKMLSSNDSDAIELSMTIGESSTNQQKHGLGSQSIRALVEKNPDGALWVFSNHGVYYKNRDSSKPELRDFGGSISGTIVQWNIKLNG
ncbi:hypothetical protein [Shewanella algae]|uniref:hypothetical protein n=1 Tax=Shewanella algae TaxID=38313 RepID=UPI00302C8748|nr:hypothetical protein [Shewanella algae]